MSVLLRLSWENAGTLNSVQTRGIVKTSGFARVTCKSGAFTKFTGPLKGFLFVESLKQTGAPEKIKTTKEIARKVDFSEPRGFAVHPVCTLLTVAIILEMAGRLPTEKYPQYCLEVHDQL